MIAEQVTKQTPEQAYQDAINNGFTSDPVQAEAVQLTQYVYQQLISQKQTSYRDKIWHNWYRSVQHNSLFRRLFKQTKPSIKGLYFWGGVGRGKTWLIDSFFNTLPFSNKQRIHFHPFMQVIHEQLKCLPKTPDPLVIIAKKMAQQNRVICIDEFHVQDITDAMLLAGLLDALFSYGVILVATSNIAPGDLYKNGLQRELFLPAIQLIKQHTQVFELNNDTDYRDRVLAKEGCYHTPLNQYNNDLMLQHFIKLSDHAPIIPQAININNRAIKVLALNQQPHTIVWFDFSQLCDTARSNSDYLIIAEKFKHLLITGVYQMDEQKDDVAKRFMHLIDALYDNHCCLIISAESEPGEIYHGRLLAAPFQRTVSRLKEMRSKLYRGRACNTLTH